jgi:hypothetical protein
MKKPDPPGGEEFVVQSNNARFDCLSRGSMSTMTDPYGPNLSPPTISSHSIPNAVSSQNTNNESFTVGLISNSTNDPDDSCNAYPDHHDFQLLSIGFPHQALVLNHVQQYCSSRGFMTFHQVEQNKILVGGIPGYFDKFVDNEVDLVVVTGKQELASVHKKKATGFMTDEGPAFPLVSECFGWTHLLDRRHFATQILSAWHGLDDPQQFQSDVYKILDTPSVETMNLLPKQALSKYRTDLIKLNLSSRKSWTSNINFAILIPAILLLLDMFPTREWNREWLLKRQMAN